MTVRGRAARRTGRSRSAAALQLPAVLGSAVVAVHLAMAVLAASSAVHTGGDNAAYLSLANSLARHGAYAETWHPGAPPHAKYPPAYPAALAVMILAGAKTWGAFKALSVVWTGLAAGFCFLWLRRRAGVWTAAALSLLFGMAPALLWASQWVLSDPMFVALTLASLWLLTPSSRPREPLGGQPEGRVGVRLDPRTWAMATGLALAVAAFFTRSAGLPLVAAAAVCLVLDRRWKALAGFAALFALPTILWHVRPGAEYAADFWLVNPYVPEMGRAGPGDLAWRVGENVWRYATDYVPGGLVGVAGALGTVGGLILAGLGLGGWLRKVRRRPGVAECFFALYAGVVLLWPVQWSGDRFALPLLPLVLLYAAEALAFLGRRAGRVFPVRGSLAARRTLAAAAFALVAVPPVLSWVEDARADRACRAETARAGPMGCLTPEAKLFHAMAVWAGSNLPEGSIVISRKPRLFHVFSGLPSVVFPFSTDDRLLLAEADSLGAEYLLRGSWDNSVPTFVDPVVAANPDRFCRVTALRHGSGVVMSLLAVKPPPSEDVWNGPTPSNDVSRDSVQVGLCSEWAGRQRFSLSAALSSMTVPLLDR